MTERDDNAGRPSGSRPPRRDGAAAGSGRGGDPRRGAGSGSGSRGGSSDAGRGGSGGGSGAGRGGSSAGRGGSNERGGRGGTSRGGAQDARPAGSSRSARDPGGDRRPRLAEPPLPDDATAAELDRSVRAELASLAKLNADTVARHLVMAGRLLDEDPEAAYLHATFARERAGRVGAVREAAGLAAYRTERYAEALAELRAARRIGGDQSLLPVMADCERGLGRPEKALAMAGSEEAATLDAMGRAEMLIVASGARRDLGQPEAAALLLQGSELRPEGRREWSARLFYAYAEAMLASGREAEATAWFGHAAAADPDGETDASERLDELAGVTFTELPDEEPVVHDDAR